MTIFDNWKVTLYTKPTVSRKHYDVVVYTHHITKQLDNENDVCVVVGPLRVANTS
jgi:hypothetical protein